MRKSKTINTIKIPDLYQILLGAAEMAGGSGGLLSYFEKQALENPQLFINLLTKITDMNRSWRNDETVQITKIELSAPQFQNRES